ncbi:hypothetical protein D9619_013346 [Psilocybe cf. subviscida]|uniref:Uncharacterized protein n=1 Tax=Psilocybe cf. subviscida TaxID=2480587 RepID=A0A8H5BRT5_9AGAR|nr:hypothetical protein D9619_013346 [Psilocybe cf. subviscida]
MPSSQKSVPPFCKCTVHHCSDYVGGGRTLSRNVFNRHQLDERSSSATLLFQQAERVSADALKAQMEDLSAHLAASTLSDQVSGPSNIPGGRLWGKESLANDCYESTPRPASPGLKLSTSGKSSRRHTPRPRDQEQEVLQHLRDVDEALDISSKEIASDILSVVPPSLKTVSTVFPLEVYFEALARLSDQLSMVSFKSAEVNIRLKCAKEKLDQSLKLLTDAKDAWLTRLGEIEDEKQSRGGVPYSTDHHFEPVLEKADPIMQVTFFTIMACQVVFGVGLRGCNFLLQMLQYILHLSFARAGPTLSIRDRKLLADIPRDFRTTAEEFHLNPRTTVSAVCPELHCHATYDPRYEDDSPIPIYPETCSYQAFRGGAECGAQLLRPQYINGHIVHLPVKTFVRSPLAERAAVPGEYQKILKRIESAHCESLNLAFEFLPGIVHPSTALGLEPERVKKSVLAETILEWRLQQTELAESKIFTKGSIVTRDEVREIRADIVQMCTPSWLASVPCDLGEARHGKLKADQWRVLGTVYLPVSLMRLWEEPDTDDNEEALMRKKMLEATIALISAIRIATSQTASRSKAALFHSSKKQSPNLSFDRQTYAHFFSKTGVRKPLQIVLVDMSSVLSMGQEDEDTGSDDEDTEPSLTFSHSRLKLSDPTQDALQRFSNGLPLSIARTLQFHSVNGRRYCRSSRHRGNSSVLVKTPSNPEPIPAQIQDIIQTNAGEVLFAVRYHGRPTARDPFAKYPLLGISLWTAPEEPTMIVSPMDVHSHFASCSFATETTEAHIAVVSLSRE